MPFNTAPHHAPQIAPGRAGADAQHPAPVIGGAHIPGANLAGPVPRYSPNTPGTLAAVTRRPRPGAELDGTSALVVLELPDTVLAALARAVHRGTGVDGARAFARLALGDDEARRGLLAVPAVRDALTVTITLDDACELLAALDDALVEGGQLGRDAEAAAGEANPDDERDLRLDADLLDAGERPAL